MPGERVEQGGLAGAAGADDGQQALLADREGHVVEQGLAAVVDGDRQVLDVEGDLAGVDVLLELVADQAERGVADADDVAGADRRAVDRLAVEVGAVVAAEVDDLVRRRRAARAARRAGARRRRSSTTRSLSAARPMRTTCAPSRLRTLVGSRRPPMVCMRGDGIVPRVCS